jgi:signal transduction histidine kinase
MSWTRSLRARLTVLFVAIAGAAVLGAALLMNSVVDHAVWGPLDAELMEEAETLCTLVAAGQLGGMQTAVTAIAGERHHGPGKFVRVLGPDGRPIAEAGRVPGRIRRAAAPVTRGAETITLRRDAMPMRVVRYPVDGGCGGVVGVDVRRHVGTLVRARIGIATSALALLVTLGWLAWLVTARATAEIDRLAAEVATIEAGSLDRRLAQRRTLEVDRLASVMNRLLARLEAAVTHLRRFTADAAHELRTPVAALRARLEVAIGGPPTAAAYRDGLVDALEQAERLGRLAEDLLTLSAVEARVAAGRDEEVRLDLLAREVVDALEPVAQEQGRTLDCDASGPVSVRGAPQLLKRVVLNLVDNAFRHTPPGAPVRIAVSRHNGTAEIVVEDRGPGMSKEDMADAFQRFARGRAATGGSGLGLALCREIVVAHGGRIDLASEVGRGTRVIVELPQPFTSPSGAG